VAARASASACTRDSRDSRSRNPSLFLVLLLLLHHQRLGHSRYHSFSILGARAPGPILVQSRPTCAGGSEGGERWGTTAQESGNLSPGELPHRLCATNCDGNLLQKRNREYCSNERRPRWGRGGGRGESSPRIMNFHSGDIRTHTRTHTHADMAGVRFRLLSIPIGHQTPRNIRKWR